MLYSYIKNRILNNKNNYLNENGKKITFIQLIEKAENLGGKLVESKYGIKCKSNINNAISVLACLYAHKTAVILSENYGSKHSNKIIDSVKLNHFICDEGVTSWDNYGEETEDLSDTAFIMCTSGTTGNPKGSMITYENLFVNLKDIDTYFNVKNNNNILICRPLFHCAVLTGEFFISLIKGLNIFFLNNTFDLYELIHCIDKNNINVMCGTPTLFYHLCSTCLKNNRMLNLSTVVSSGECMTETVAKSIRACLPHADIYNVYGLTEASPRVSYLPPNLFDKYPTSVGKFLNAISGKILNDELLIKGKSIMKKYYGRSGMSTDSDGWLHTGDRAYFENDLLFINGRMDDLIIRSGMNIYPQEIENAIKKDDHILEAFAFGVKDINAGQKIHLLVETSDYSTKDIFLICKKYLPSFQMPDTIKIVKKIEKNPAGKIIRNASLY